MSVSTTSCQPVLFSPGIEPDDPLAAYWLRQVTVRLRREICWLWHERGFSSESSGILPPFTDKVSSSLEMSRFREEKKRFFETDVTAAHLSEQLAATPPVPSGAMRGSFGWVATEVGLDSAAAFVFALALSVTCDQAAGNVIAACLNDAMSTRPSLALAQRLWDRPAEILPVADRSHPLFRLGLIRPGGASEGRREEIDWDQTLSVPIQIALPVLFPSTELSSSLRTIETLDDPAENELGEREKVIVSQLRSGEPDKIRLFPVSCPRGADAASAVAQITHAAGRSLVTPRSPPDFGAGSLDIAATCCWLRGVDLLLPLEAPPASTSERRDCLGLPTSVPINLFVVCESEKELRWIPQGIRGASLTVRGLSHAEREALWHDGLGTAAQDIGEAISECSRRYRLEKLTILSACRSLQVRSKISPGDLRSTCRAEINVEMGELAQRVHPRFTEDELVLPPKQRTQLDAVRNAMTALTDVHYRWGTARPWNEAGISVLFAGSPGTGKTMAAEVLAAELGLPLYRIDLSQVVNKYVGETPKNLKRIFDAADLCDLILFFDEAEAVFSSRTEVKDAHDRFANTEVSYLLTRMESAKGLTILATNRREDLDRAFVRRLRYIVDFPKPGLSERRSIWEKSIPETVDASDVDLEFLAKKFPFSGGHIRSAIFNACLESAHARGVGEAERQRLSMRDMVISAWRELEKLNHSMSPAQLGRYRPIVENILSDEGRD